MMEGGLPIHTAKKVKVLLVGGGHAHLYILKKLQYIKWGRVEVTLLSPSRYQYYSGMFSGYAEGLYQLKDIRADLHRLAEKGGVHWIKGYAVSVDPHRCTVETSAGEVVQYDVISFDIGSLIKHDHIPGTEKYATMLKPNYRIAEVIHEIREQDQVVVVGGGASGIEMSLSLQAWRNEQGLPTPVTLISADRLLPQYSGNISRKIEHIVRRKGLNLHVYASVTRVERGSVFINTKDGQQMGVPFDQLLWLAGPKAPPVFEKSNLPQDDRGYLLVQDTLQATGYPNMFGAGDCITMANHRLLPKAGVYAVRESKVLWHNLQRYIDGGQMISYHPQSSFLSILSTGDEQGFFMYRGVSFHGKWAWKLKRKIDTDFMQQYQ